MGEQRDRSDAQQAMLATLCVVIGFGLWAYPVSFDVPELGWFTPVRFPASVMMMLLSFYFLLLRRR